jgi:HEPN domain-containing protein
MPDKNHAEYWIEMSEYDLKTAKWMYRVRRYLYVGFMCHQSAEKILKAKFVAAYPPEQLPHSHKLIELAKKSDVLERLTDAQKEFLRELTPLNVESRYPRSKDKAFAILTRQYCKELLKRTEEIVRWLKEN